MVTIENLVSQKDERGKTGMLIDITYFHAHTAYVA